MPTWAVVTISIASAIINAAILVFSAFGKGYGNKKGENLATKEDIAEITEITRRIETDILDRSWIKQRNRQLKEEIILEAFKLSVLLQDAVREFDTQYFVQSRNITPTKHIETLRKALLPLVKNEYEAVTDAFASYYRAHLLTRIACGQEVADAFSLVAYKSLDITREFSHRVTYDTEYYTSLSVAISALIPHIQKELDIPPEPKT